MPLRTAQLAYTKSGGTTTTLLLTFRCQLCGLLFGMHQWQRGKTSRQSDFSMDGAGVYGERYVISQQVLQIS